MGLYTAGKSVPVLVLIALALILNIDYAHGDISAGIQGVRLESVASLPAPQSLTHITIPFHPVNSTAYSVAKSQSITSQYAQKVATPVPGPEPYIKPYVVSVTPGGFDGIDESEAFGIPPDVAMAVGPNHIAEFVNFVGEIWDKTGTPIGSLFSLYSFFGAANTDFLSDPKILYDSQSGRWFASVLDITTSSVIVAVSATNDPTGTWTTYNVIFGTTPGPGPGTCPDQPKMGLNSDKFVISVNDFSNSCGVFGGISSFLGADFFVFDKSQLISGVALNKFSRFGPDITKFAIMPAQSLSSTNALYMTSVDFPSSTKVHFFTLTGLPTGLNTGGVTKTLVDLLLPSPLTINVPPAAVQATSDLIDTGDNRILDAKWSQGKLWVSLNDACTPLGDTVTRSCARLIQINTASTPTISQDFDIGFSGYYLFYPAISIEGSGSLDVISGYSTPVSYPSLFVTGQSALGASGTYQNSKAVAFGSTSNTDGRYGDYFSAVIDPSNSTKSWVAGEYMHLPPSFGSSTWSTFIAATTTTNPGLSLNTNSGTVGTTVTVSGGFFDDNSLTTIKYNGVTRDTQTTDDSGNFSSTFAIPSSTFGAHPISATDAISNTASSTFTVASSISLNTNSGPVGTSITITGHGFAASSSTAVKYDGVTKATVMTNATGSFKTTFTAPPSIIGAHNVSATDAAAHTGGPATFTIVPSVTLNTNSGPVGTSITITGNGFASSSSTIVSFNGVTRSILPTNTVGTFTTTFSVLSSPAGANPVSATDGASNTASTAFTVTPKIGIIPSSGPVGTSITVTGHGFAVGSSTDVKYNSVTQTTVTTNGTGSFTATFTAPSSVIGSNSVSATDGATNTASTTFTTGSSISLDTSSGTIGTPVTVTGKGFAANSLTLVKYNGITKNTITTDPAGSFTATFNIPSSTFGAHPISATDAASHTASSTFTVASSISLNTNSGPVGTPITITGHGFAASSSTAVKYDGVTKATIITNATGSFKTTFTAPPSIIGAHNVSATDAAAHTGGPATFTVVPKISLNTASGPVGTSLTVTGTGFAPSSLTAVKYNGVTQTTVTTDTAGSFTATFLVPSLAGNAYTILATDASSNSASTSFTITPKITTNTLSGPSGTPVTVTGTGFAPSSLTAVKYNGVTQTTVTTSSIGGFTVTFTIPSSGVVANTISAIDGASGSSSATFSTGTPSTMSLSDLSLQIWNLLKDVQNTVNMLADASGPIFQTNTKVTDIQNKVNNIYTGTMNLKTVKLSSPVQFDTTFPNSKTVNLSCDKDFIVTSFRIITSHDDPSDDFLIDSNSISARDTVKFIHPAFDPAAGVDISNELTGLLGGSVGVNATENFSITLIQQAGAGSADAINNAEAIVLSNGASCSIS